MSPRQSISITELKVGLFVVVVCAILALAIFAIGSQVGLFEEQFTALTYLSNVSGLKPGDVVLLGGVEVGNVTRVQISKPGELPQTTQNTRILQEVAELMDELETFQGRAETAESQLIEAREAYQQTVGSAGEGSSEARQQARNVEDLEADLGFARRQVGNIREEIERKRGGLQNILVEMRVNSTYRDWIRSDSNIALGSIGLLGDKYIEITLGRTDDPPRTITLEVEGWLGKSTEEAVLVTGIQEASFGELITGANDILANFKTLSDQVQGIMRSFESGEGTIGKFITDPSFFNNLNSTVENANRAMQRIGNLASGLGEGEGTISKLIREDTLHTRLVTAVDNLASLLEKVEEGEGTAGRLVNDPSLYEGVNEALGEIKLVTERINRGEGTLGKLSTDDKLYNSLGQSVDELTAILKDFQAGQGTLGLLAKDEELYRNLNEVSTELVKLLYDFRQDPKKFLTIKVTLF